MLCPIGFPRTDSNHHRTQVASSPLHLRLIVLLRKLVSRFCSEIIQLISAFPLLYWLWIYLRLFKEFPFLPVMRWRFPVIVNLYFRLLSPSFCIKVDNFWVASTMFHVYWNSFMKRYQECNWIIVINFIVLIVFLYIDFISIWGWLGHFVVRCHVRGVSEGRTS